MSEEKKCLLCAADVDAETEYFRCDGCGAPLTLVDGTVKINNEDWPEQHYADKGHNMRHPVTRVVRSLLHDYIHGKELPRKQLNCLIALLLDHHCHLEGVKSPRIESRPRPIPPPHKVPPYKPYKPRRSW